MIAPAPLIRTLLGAALLGGAALAVDSEISDAETRSLRAEVRRTATAPLSTGTEEMRQLKQEAHRWGIGEARAAHPPTEAEEMRQLKRLYREFLLAREPAATQVAEER